MSTCLLGDRALEAWEREADEDLSRLKECRSHRLASRKNVRRLRAGIRGVVQQLTARLRAAGEHDGTQQQELTAMRSQLAAAEARAAAGEQHNYAHEAAQAELQQNDEKIWDLQAECHRLEAAGEACADIAALQTEAPQQVRGYCTASTSLPCALDPTVGCKLTPQVTSLAAR